MKLLQSSSLDQSAYSVYNVGMQKIQYTIRGIPLEVDRVIRKRAAQTGRSFNQTVVDMLTQQTFGDDKVPPGKDFEWLFNTGDLDEAFDEAIADLSRVDKEMWQ